MAADFTIKQGTTRPILTDTLTYSDGTSVNLTGATVTFVMRLTNAGTATVNAAATITSATNPATVSYTFTATDTATVGNYIASWHVVFSDGSTMDFPTVGYLEITVEASLTTAGTATIVALADVKDYLTIPPTDRDHDEKLALFITAATPIIEQIVGPVLSQQFEEWHDGGQTAILLRHRPVITLNACSFYIGPNEYVAAQVGTPQQGSIYSVELDTAGRVVRRGPGGSTIPFPAGPQAIHVVYTAGRSPIPDNIRMATLELIRANYQITQQAGGRPDVDEEMFDRPAVGFLVPGRVRELLVPHRRAPSVA